ncbi:CvpA family protein [bacterium]|nr:CvpA family protein [bacterium]
MFIYQGYKDGFFRAIILFVAFAVVYFIGVQFMAKVGGLSGKFLVLLPETARIFGFLVTVMIVWVVTYIVVRRLKFVDLTEELQNSKINKIAGALVGLFGGIMAVGIMTMVFVIFPIQGRLGHEYHESYFRKMTQRGSVLMYDQSWGRLTKGKTFKLKVTQKLGGASTWENENFSELIKNIKGKPAPETEIEDSNDLIFNPRRGRKD